MGGLGHATNEVQRWSSNFTAYAATDIKTASKRHLYHTFIIDSQDRG